MTESPLPQNASTGLSRGGRHLKEERAHSFRKPLEGKTMCVD